MVLKKLLVIIFMLFSLGLSAQDKIPINDDDYTNNKVEMADQLRADGKIYVVVAIIIVIFGGIVTYLVFTERKVKRLEKELGITD